MIGSWLLLPTLFALTYASAYYGPIPIAGSPFPARRASFEPDHTDFLYFSFTIAVTAQTSDVAVTTREMRRLVLCQSVLSFVFNTTILAFAINAAAGVLLRAIERRAQRPEQLRLAARCTTRAVARSSAPSTSQRTARG